MYTQCGSSHAANCIENPPYIGTFIPHIAVFMPSVRNWHTSQSVYVTRLWPNARVSSMSDGTTLRPEPFLQGFEPLQGRFQLQGVRAAGHFDRSQQSGRRIRTGETRALFAAAVFREPPLHIRGNAGVEPPSAAFQQIYVIRFG